jgi:hypothetical protein
LLCHRCQDVIIAAVELDENIARNRALKENVIMMVVCIELRIPLLLLGKPGSSKSLAKTVVGRAMQRKGACCHPLFKSFKDVSGALIESDTRSSLLQVQLCSFQCSQLSSPVDILGSFEECAKLQENENLDKFVAVVVLEEVGLAEDSPKMPLKVNGYGTIS